MKIFIFLLFSHFIGDVFLRTKFMNKYKSKSLFIMIFHCFIWSVCVSIPLEVYGLFTISKFMFLFIGHFGIDSIKAAVDQHPSWERSNKSDISKYKVIDQFAHIGQLGVVLWII